MQLSLKASIVSPRELLLFAEASGLTPVHFLPWQVLDAPCLQDDFYLNLVDWSSQNVLAVGLGPSVYLWSACTSKVTKLCDLGNGDEVCSVAWTQRGTYLAVGTFRDAEVQIWDAVKCRKCVLHPALLCSARRLAGRV